METALLSVQEAAKLKAVTRAAIYIAIKEGRLPRRKVLGRLALTKREVLAWTPSPSRGRVRGGRLSEKTKAKIAAGQRRSWARRKDSRA